MDDKKAERETLLYVGYIRHVCTTILSIPRMQIYEYILAFVCLALVAQAISTTETNDEEEVPLRDRGPNVDKGGGGSPERDH